MEDDAVRLRAALVELEAQRGRADNATQAWANASAQRDALAEALRLCRHELRAERNRVTALENQLAKHETTSDVPALQRGA